MDTVSGDFDFEGLYSFPEGQGTIAGEAFETLSPPRLRVDPQVEPRTREFDDAESLLEDLQTARSDLQTQCHVLNMKIYRFSKRQADSQTTEAARLTTESRQREAVTTDNIRQIEARLKVLEGKHEECTQSVTDIGLRLNLVLDYFQRDINPWLTRMWETFTTKVPTLPSGIGTAGESVDTAS